MALEELRTSWDLCENDTQRAKTLKIAGDAGTALGCLLYTSDAADE